MTQPVTLNVNLFAGPGVGKSATAWGLSWALKMQGIHVEYVAEYPKLLQYRGTLNMTPQRDIVGPQLDWMEELQGKVAVIVTDGPALQSLAYCTGETQREIAELIEQRSGTWQNLNVLLHRDIRGSYESKGRYQNEQQAVSFHTEHLAPFVRQNIPDVVEIQLDKGTEWMTQLTGLVKARLAELEQLAAAV